jgi:hypothetical protein
MSLGAVARVEGIRLGLRLGLSLAKVRLLALKRSLLARSAAGAFAEIGALAAARAFTEVWPLAIAGTFAEFRCSPPPGPFLSGVPIEVVPDRVAYGKADAPGNPARDRATDDVAGRRREVIGRAGGG